MGGGTEGREGKGAKGKHAVRNSVAVSILSSHTYNYFRAMGKERVIRRSD